MDLVTDRPYWPAHPTSQVPDPDQPDWIVVQPGAYHEYASDPVAQPASSDDARFGTYLLRLVEAQLPAQISRGWQVVGRLDDGAQPPEPSPSPAAPTLMSLHDLQQLLADVPRVGSRTLLAIGRLSQNIPDGQKTCPICDLGTIDDANGRPVTIVGNSDVQAALVIISAKPITAPMALHFPGDGTVELLGLLDTNGPDGLVWPATTDGVRDAKSGIAGDVIAVRGWMGWSGVVPCPAPFDPSGATAPPDTPFDGCPWAWISAQPVTQTSIAVNYQAYQAYANSDPSSTDPVWGTYVLRLVVDPRPSQNGARGWQVVGRLEDSTPPTSEPTVPPTTPIPEPTPTPMPTVPTTELTILTFAELQQRLVSLPMAQHQWILLAKAIIDRVAVKPQGTACRAPALCPVGTITDANGTPVNVVAGADVLTAIGIASVNPIEDYVALRAVDNNTVELLGLLDPDGPNGLVWPASANSINKAVSGGDGAGAVFVVEGWLAGTAFGCPPLPSLDPDNSFAICADSWVTASPVAGTGGGIDDSTFTSADGIPVQPSAFTAFAPDQGSMLAGGAVRELQAVASYLVRAVQNPQTPCSATCNGWRVVARLTDGTAAEPSPSPAAPQTPVPTPSSQPTTSPSPSPLTGVLSRDATKMAIDATYTTASAAGPRDIIGDVSIDMTQRPAPVSRECHDPTGNCTVIGTIAGFADTVGTVVERDGLGSPPALPLEAGGPIALRVSSMGQVEYLGQVARGPTGLEWNVGDAIAKQPSLPIDGVLAVHGWLAWGGGMSCGPAPDQASPPPVPPFQCGTHDFITPAFEQIVFPSGPNAWEGRGPADGLTVQMDAFNHFVPNPQLDAAGFPMPTEGTYLVQSVINHSSWGSTGGFGTRGWLVVGRIDAEPAPASSMVPQPTVRSAAELEALLAGDRASWVGRTVVVDGSIAPGDAVTCAGPDPCHIGILAGTSEGVVASSQTISMFPTDTNLDTPGLMAFAVRDAGLEYFGPVGQWTDGGVVVPVTELGTPNMLDGQPGRIAIVGGWLVSPGNVPCPGPMPNEPGPPPDTPFSSCFAGWISPVNSPAWLSGTDGSSSVNMPAGSVRVQWDAYQRFAPDPQIDPQDAPNDGTVPRLGTYVMRLVADPRPAANPATGWQVVGRIDG